MTVTGLSADLFYINNPILIRILDLDPDVNYIDLQLTNLNDANNLIPSNILRIYPNIENQIIDFDLSEVIKANFTRPDRIGSSVSNDSSINTNYVRFNLSMQEILSSGGVGIPFNSTKTYLRGGVDSQETNVTTTIGTDLKVTEKHLSWGGLPFEKYYIDANKQIAITNVIPDADIQQMSAIGCDPFYIRFLNLKGGYSFWYFPVWEQIKKTKSSGYVTRSKRSESFSLGYEATHTVKAESRIKRQHFAIAESLRSSQEVYVYNRYGFTWGRIEVKEGTFEQNTYEDVQDFNVEFNLHLNNDERLIW